jgi:hypothetical protein
MDFYRLGINLEPLLLINEKVLHGITLIALELNDIAGLFIADNGAIAGKLLLDHLEDLAQVIFDGDAFDRGQRFATIALLDTDVDVYGAQSQRAITVTGGVEAKRTGLGGLLSCFPSILVLRIRKGILSLLVPVALGKVGGRSRSAEVACGQANSDNGA